MQKHAELFSSTSFDLGAMPAAPGRPASATRWRPAAEIGRAISAAREKRDALLSGGTVHGRLISCGRGSDKLAMVAQLSPLSLSLSPSLCIPNIKLR
jgi:hypothetical protein